MLVIPSKLGVDAPLDLSDYQRLVVDTRTRERALTTRSALGAALRDVVGGLHDCFSTEPLDADTSPFFPFAVDSTAHAGRVRQVSFVHVRDGAPLSERAIACLTARLATVRTFRPVAPDQEMLASFEGSIDFHCHFHQRSSPSRPPDSGTVAQ
jgi:hypothetical protein